MATDLMSLVAKITVDDKDYEKGLSNAESKAQKFSKGIKTGMKIGAAAVGVTAAAIGGLSKSIFSAAKQTAEYGDTIDKQSQRVGLSAEAYQKWDYVMKIAGSEMSNMRIGLKTMTNQLEKAKNGGKEAQDNFAKLGISMEDLNNMSREEAFGKVIKGFQGMQDSTERAALANKMFGRSGQELAPLFNQSAESTDELLRKAEDYGMVMSNDAVKASAAFKDSLTTLSQTATGLKNRLTGDLMPGITQITDGLALMFTRDGQEEGLEKFNKGLSETIDNVVAMIPKFVDIGVPIVETVATGIISNLPKMGDAVFQIVSNIGTYIVKELPTLINAGVQIVLALVNGIADNLPSLTEAVVTSISQIAEILTSPNTLTMLMEGLVGMMEALAESIGTAIPILMDAIPTVISNIVDFLLQAMPMLLTAGVQIVLTLAQGILQNLPQLMPTVIQIIIALVTMLTNPDVIVQLVSAAVDIVIALADGLVQALPQLLSVVPVLISNLGKALIRLAPKLLSVGPALIKAFVKGVRNTFRQLGKLGKDIIDKIKKSIQEKIDNAKNWGKDLIQNFIDGIKEKWDKLKGDVLAIADYFKKLFKHSTPEMGPMKDDDTWMPDMMDNFIEGIDSRVPQLTRTVSNVADIIGDEFGYVGDDGGGFDTYNDVQRFEFVLPDGNAPMKQIARLLFPYMQIVAKEKGA